MHPHEYRIFVVRCCDIGRRTPNASLRYIAVNERYVFVTIDVVPVTNDFPHPELSWKTRFRNTMHESLTLQSMGNELRNRDEREIVFFRELLELGTTRSGAVFIQDFTDDSRRIESCEAREINSRFCVTNALQNSTVARAEWRNVAGSTKVGGNRSRIYCNTNSLCAVLCADSGRHAKTRGCIDADSERSALFFGVVLAHLRKLKLIGALACKRKADPSAPVLEH